MKTDKVEAYLQRLNEEQQRIVAVGPGLCVVSGSPGSGKTTAIVARVARLVRDGLPGRYILATTFTKAAAAELTNRLADLGIVDCRFGTKHSLCWEFLQMENPAVREGYLKVDEGSKLEMELKHIVTQFQQRKRLPNRGVDLMELERYIADCKATGPCYIFGNPFGMNSEAEDRQLALTSKFSERIGSGIRPEVLYEIYTELELRRGAMGLLTYDDMTTWTWMHLACDDSVLKRWRSRWSAIIEDEAQDQVPLQWDLSFVLAGYPSRVAPERFEVLPKDSQKSLMFCGQIAQSLFGFRSADPAIFIELCTEPGAGFYELQVNYRSVPEICAVAEAFGKDEDWAIPSKIISHSEDWGDVALHFSTYTHGTLEAAGIVRKIAELIKANHPLPEIVVMSRLSFFLNLVEIECIRNKIPYVKRTAGGFIESREAQAMLAYMRVACGVDPDGSSLKKTIMAPFKYISRDELAEADLKVRQSEAQGRKLNLLEALLSLSMAVRKKRSLLDLRDLLYDLASDVEQGMAPSQMLTKIIDTTDFLEHIRKEEGSPVPDASKSGVLDELVGLANLFEDAMQFLTFCDQLKASLKLGRQLYQVKEDKPRDAIVLSTIHRMKGLACTTAFIADVIQGRFPWNRATSMGEELRLMYTAISRAKKQVFISDSRGDGAVESSILTRVKQAAETAKASRNGAGTEAA